MARGVVSGSGSEDGLAKAFEIALTPVIFAAIGFGLDRWLDTGPWLALSFGMVAFGLKAMIEWYRYAQRMDAHETDLAARRPVQKRGVHRDSDLDEPASLPTGVSLDASEPPEPTPPAAA